MAKFDYIALDSKGQEQKGSMDAPSQKEALTRLGQMGLHPTSVEAAAAPAKSKGKSKGKAKASGSKKGGNCLLYTSPSPRDKRQSRMPSSA